jgi:predicted anti-sigma-YlaC factor YlaD
MNCPECHAWLQRRLDGDSPVVGEALDGHLAVCPACRALYGAGQRLSEGLRLLSPPALPVGLADRIVTRVVSAQRRQRRFRRWLIGTAVAASLLLVVFVGSQRPPPTPGPVEPPLVRAQPPSLQQQVEEAGVAVVALTRRTADETVSQTRWLLPALVPLPAEGDAPDWPEPPLDLPAQPLREVGQGVSAGLEPVATSARRAVSLFLRELPPMETTNSGP